jgi:leukotriene-A4 hydrolase
VIAIAVGDLEYRSLGDRVGVVTEPSFMEACVSELENLQVMLDTAESYLTPYIWGNYTILVLPPSFPMGGMENILLTFASPTIITGDKSQVDVATHEIAHSWTGNDVTCENWSNMWLNEGFTVFEERKVSGKIHGVDFSKVASFLGNISMVDSMEDYGMDSNYSSLFPIVGDNLPDDAFSEIPYEKGFQLLYYMESLIGEDNMQTMLREWIDEYKQKSVNYKMFGAKFRDFISKNFDAEKAKEIDEKMQYETWVTAPGLPPVLLDFTTVLLNESSAMADGYIYLDGSASPKNYADFYDFYSSLKVVFIERLIARFSVVDLDILKRIDADFNITETVDPECKQRWFSLGIKKGYEPVFPQAHNFISTQGRLKYLTPIYQALLDAGEHDLAVTWYEENKDFYHPMA